MSKTFITCAVTGNITRPEQNPRLPITPEHIAHDCLEAAEAGASIVHIHVRDPLTGAPSMDLGLYQDVVRRIRKKNTELIINLTTGPGGRFRPDPQEPRIAAPGTTLMRPELRVAHIVDLKPDICTLDLNTMNSGEDVVMNTPSNVRIMAEIIRDADVCPEIELFDSGDIVLARDLQAEGLIPQRMLCSFVLGVKYGFPPLPETALFARGLLPPHAHFTAFGVGRHAFPMGVQSYLLGGGVRIGMEDTVMLARSQPAPSNAALVERMRSLLEPLGAEIMNAGETRAVLGLRG